MVGVGVGLEPLSSGRVVIEREGSCLQVQAPFLIGCTPLFSGASGRGEEGIAENERGNN